MLARVDPKGFYPNIASASGPIKNEILTNQILYRSFGPGGTTHGVSISKSKAIGAYWGSRLAACKRWRMARPNRGVG